MYDANKWYQKPVIASGEPVLKVVENILWYVEALRSTNLDALEVHATCHVVPPRNAGTIRERWSAWSVFSARGAGDIVSAGKRLLQHAVLIAPMRSRVIAGDDL